jgi:hypothetical protein
MSRTADYVAKERPLLESERAALEADIEMFRKMRKDEKRFLDVDAETKKLAEVKEQIAAAVEAGKAQAEEIIRSANARAKDIVAEVNRQKFDVEQALEAKRAEIMKLQNAVEQSVALNTFRAKALDDDTKVLHAKEDELNAKMAKLKAALAAHKANLENVEF